MNFAIGGPLGCRHLGIHCMLGWSLAAEISSNLVAESRSATSPSSAEAAGSAVVSTSSSAAMAAATGSILSTGRAACHR